MRSKTEERNREVSSKGRELYFCTRNMKRRMCCFLMATLQITIITTWHISATTSRPFASYPQQEQIPEHPGADLDLEQGVYNEEGGGTRYRGESRLGSRPPSCEHKCGGCNPCVAIQIPATADHMGVQYANYEPEGWKCKCGTVFFNP